jgi:hypothetical protein
VVLPDELDDGLLPLQPARRADAARARIGVRMVAQRARDALRFATADSRLERVS